MKIKEIKVYQSILFEGRQVTFFTTRDPITAHYKIETLDNFVRVTSPKDDVLIGFANVAYMKVDEPKQEAPKLQPEEPKVESKDGKKTKAS